VTYRIAACLFLVLLTDLPDAVKIELQKPTVEAFETYIRSAENRIEREVHDEPFLWTDTSANRRQRVLQGEIVVESRLNGTKDVPDGLIHDWTGAVFIPGTTLARTLALVQDYSNHKNIYKPEVADSALLSRNGNSFQVRLRLVKKQVVTVVLDTDHDVTYFPMSPLRCYSQSRSTRIAEVVRAGTADEHELPPGRDHGLLWRLNSYWRFEERDGGVYAECEAISLTRSVPAGLGWVINPIVRSLPRDSLLNTLRETREALGPGRAD